jgi:hypothetical protein
MIFFGMGFRLCGRALCIPSLPKECSSQIGCDNSTELHHRRTGGQKIVLILVVAECGPRIPKVPAVTDGTD